MALRSGNPFYFLFSTADQVRIDSQSITVEDVPYAAAPISGNPYPQSLRIRFSLSNTQGSAPQIRPLGPGLMTFHADTIPGKSIPTPAQATAANYGNWPTTGTLRLTLRDPEVVERLSSLSGLPAVPNHLWYSKVKLTQSFLFQSLAALREVKAIGGKTLTLPPPPSDAWVRNAIVGFLKGNFSAELKAGAQPSEDSQATVEMPSLEVTQQTGAFDLYVTCAFDGIPFDGEYKDYDVPTGVAPWEAAHPRYGAIPARLVYRALRTTGSGNMIDAGAGNIVPDTVLAPSSVPGVPDYIPVRFTRVWKAVEDRSVHFPSQVVRAEQLTSVSPLVVDQRLPSHGILFIAITPIHRLTSSDFRVSLSNPSNNPQRQMWWLLGNVPEVWRDPASDSPVTITLPPANAPATSIPHVVVRRRMGQEVIYDRKGRPSGLGCTYFSLRRVVRALVNNRIAGGRLNFEVYYVGNTRKRQNLQTTRDLVNEALGREADNSFTGNAVFEGKPDHTGQPAEQAPTLIPVLKAMFHDPVALQPPPGGDPQFTEGRTAYAVWQSMTPEFEGNATRRAFDPAWLGGGGPGALIALGLAADYAVNPDQTVVRAQAQSDVSFRSSVAVAMLTAGTLEPGASLQFWVLFSDLTDIRNRTVAGRGNLTGHSPIFLRYAGPAGNPTGIYVLDQTGQEALCARTGAAGSFILPWDGYNPQAWIAANWLE